jgi:hypothetical protein
MPSGRQRWLFFVITILIAACFAAAPSVFKYIRDIHPRNVALFLAQIEEEYRNHGNDGGKKQAREMLQYVQEHYRYEDRPEHQGTSVAEELATQRKRTIKSIEAYLRRQP